MTDRAFQQCINPACASTYAISEVHVACRKCGALLDIKYDWDRLPVPKSLGYFEYRWSTKGSGVQGRLDFSGVWRFRELMPFFRTEDDIVTIGEGRSNLQRADLTPLEEAAAYQLLVERGLTQEQVATRVGRSRVAVANRLRLLSLPAEARNLLMSGALTEGHARALLGCPDPQLIDVLAHRIAERQLRDYKDRLKDHTQELRHEAGQQNLGQVAELHPDRDHGFLGLAGDKVITEKELRETAEDPDSPVDLKRAARYIPLMRSFESPSSLRTVTYLSPILWT